MNKILLASLLVATSFAQPINEALPFAGAPRVGANDTVPPPAPVSPTDEQLKTIKAKLAEFRVALAALQAAGVKDDLVVDAESYGWVVENVVRVPGGFIDAPSIGKCVTILNDGLRRIAQLNHCGLDIDLAAGLDIGFELVHVARLAQHGARATGQ